MIKLKGHKLEVIHTQPRIKQSPRESLCKAWIAELIFPVPDSASGRISERGGNVPVDVPYPVQTVHRPTEPVHRHSL